MSMNAEGSNPHLMGYSLRPTRWTTRSRIATDKHRQHP